MQLVLRRPCFDLMRLRSMQQHQTDHQWRLVGKLHHPNVADRAKAITKVPTYLLLGTL